jgi:hypothetical protein
MTAVIVIVGILSALLIRVAIGAIPFIAGGHCKKKTPATLEENEKIVQAKVEEPVSSHVVQSVSVPNVTIEKPQELQVPVTAAAPQFFEERAVDQQVQMVAEKMSGSSLNSARRVQSTMHSSHHPRTN